MITDINGIVIDPINNIDKLCFKPDCLLVI